MINSSTTKRLLFRTAILTLVAALALPIFAFADQGQGRGRGKDKKREVFVNGHDARDGRLDGRGPRRDRRDRDDRDDDDNDNHNGRRDRDRDNDGINDRTEIRQQALSIGYREGVRYGQEDRANGRRSDYQNLSVYRDATTGYRDSYGDSDLYRRSFRESFRQGYEDGYRNRSASGRYGRIGDILGDIFGGRP